MITREHRLCAIAALMVGAAALGGIGCGSATDDELMVSARRGKGDVGDSTASCIPGIVYTSAIKIRSEPSVSARQLGLARHGQRLCLLEGTDGQPITRSAEGYNWSMIEILDPDRPRAQAFRVAWMVNSYAGRDNGWLRPVDRFRALIYFYPLYDAGLVSYMSNSIWDPGTRELRGVLGTDYDSGALHFAVDTVIGDEQRALVQASGEWGDSALLRDLIYRGLADVERYDPKYVESVALIISGHSGGTSIWGDLGTVCPTSDECSDDGALTFDAMGAAFPNVANKVEHIFLLGCNTAWPYYADQWSKPFPNRYSLTGFAGSGPGGGPAWRTVSEAYNVLENPAAFGVTRDDPTGVLQQLLAQEQMAVTNCAFNIYDPRCDNSGVRCFDRNRSFTEGNYELYDLQREYLNETRPEFERYLAAADPGYEDPPTRSTDEYRAGGLPAPRRHYNVVQMYLNVVRSELIPLCAQDPDNYACVSYDDWPTTTRIDWEAQAVALRAEKDLALRVTLFRPGKAAWLAANREEVQALLDHYPTVTAAAYDAAKRERCQAGTSTGCSYPQLNVELLGPPMTRKETILFVQQLRSALPDSATVKRLERALVELDPEELLEIYL